MSQPASAAPPSGLGRALARGLLRVPFLLALVAGLAAAGVGSLLEPHEGARLVSAISPGRGPVLGVVAALGLGLSLLEVLVAGLTPLKRCGVLAAAAGLSSALGAGAACAVQAALTPGGPGALSVGLDFLWGEVLPPWGVLALACFVSGPLGLAGALVSGARQTRAELQQLAGGGVAHAVLVLAVFSNSREFGVATVIVAAGAALAALVADCGVAGIYLAVDAIQSRLGGRAEPA